MNAGVGARIDRAAERLLGSIDRVDVVLVLTLVFQMLYTEGYAEFPVQAVAILGLVSRAARRHWALWATLIVAQFLLALPVQWALLPNHKWLSLWWMAAVAGALVASDPARALARAGRLMIGLVFAFATIWKLTTPDFIAGDYFEFLLVADDRVSIAAVTAGGLDADDGARNDEALVSMQDVDGPDQVLLATGPRIAPLADLMAISTIVIEGGLAIAFLAPASSRLGRRAGRWRDPVFTGFVAVTYPLAPVVSFAWILLILGLAQTDWDRPRGEVVHVGLFVLLHPIAQGSVFHDVTAKLF